MRLVTSVCLALGIAATVAAQTQTIDFEPASGYAPGNIVGQQGWSIQSGDPGGAFVIDNTVYSPMSGSTQSLKLGGQPNRSRVWTPLATSVTSGVWRVGYDFRYAPSSICRACTTAAP